MAALGPAPGHRAVPFDVCQTPAYAVQLRLTPALLEALLKAQAEGQSASIRFGDVPQANAITVGSTSFRFNALPEESCDLLRMQLGAGRGAAALVGAVRQKLMVQRNIADERERVRARAEEAERRGQERKAQLLDRKPSRSGRQTEVRTVTVPAAAPQQPRGPTPSPQQLTASMLAAPAAPQARPPAHPASAATLRARSATPPPAAAAAAGAAAASAPAAAASAAAAAATGKPMHKSASANKLGSSSQAAASPLVLSAVRSGASLRLCLIAMLSERPMPMSAIKGVLADAAARVRSFKAPKKEELERAVKAVAEHKSPGVYVLYTVLLKELDALAPAGARQQSASPSGQSGDAASPAGRAQPKSKGRAKSVPATAGTAGGNGGGNSGRRPAATAGAAGKLSAGAGGKRGRLDWTDDDSDAEQQPAAAPPVRAKQQAQQAPPPPQHQQQQRYTSSPPSVAQGAGGSTGSGGHTAGGGAAPPLSGSGGRVRRTSSSRGSDRADESWIDEHADRQPEPSAPIRSKEEYRAREAAFNAKYEAYFALHQLIAAHKKDFEALDAAARGAPTLAERERHRAELDLLHQRRGERAKRWDAAYRVLHQELAAAKARMAEFVQQLQQDQAQGQQDAGAAPPVRVK